MSQTHRQPTSGMGRRLLILGTPLAYGVVTVLHPRQFPGGGGSMYADLRGQAGTWLAVHTAQIVLIMLLGATIWALVDGLEGTAAKVARAAVLPFVAFYAAFDAIVGFATGLLVRQANGLSGAEQAAAAQQIQQYFDGMVDPGLPGLFVIVVGVAAWVVAMLAVAVARRRAGASGTAVALLAVAAVAFGFDHGFPTGTVGMAALFLAALSLERQSVKQVEPRPASVTG
jgi:lysylphosphatidylglycerol synthetase-like protein (DUF2156 family)